MTTRDLLVVLHTAAALSWAGLTVAAESGIAVSQAWSRATAPGAPVAAAYLVIEHGGTAPDRLVGARASVATRAELHSHVMEGYVAKMRPVEGVDIAPGQRVIFAPGGHHVMLKGLTRQLAEGERFLLSLTFAGAGVVEVPVTVAAPGATSPPNP